MASGCAATVSTASAVALLPVSTIPNGLDIIDCAMHRVASREENSAGDGQYYEKLFHRPFPLRFPEPHIAPELNGRRNWQRRDLFHQSCLVIGAEWIRTSAKIRKIRTARSLSMGARQALHVHGDRQDQQARVRRFAGELQDRIVARLSTGRASMSDTTQAFAFIARANSIFVRDKS